MEKSVIAVDKNAANPCDDQSPLLPVLKEETVVCETDLFAEGYQKWASE